MNLIEESVREKQKKKQNRTTKIILIAIILLVIVIVGVSAYLIYVESTTRKVILDGKSNESLNKIIITGDNGKLYAPIKEIATYLGYKSYDGSYQVPSQEKYKCYAINENEVVNFENNSNKLEKLDLTKEEKDKIYEIERVDDNVITKNGSLYASAETLEKAFNITFQYDQERNRIYIVTLPTLFNQCDSIARNNKFSGLSTNFANEKALLQDLLVVRNGDEGNDAIYGVIDSNGNTILEAKYNSIEYLPEVGDFIVSSNEKYGIMGKDGKTKIPLENDSIALMGNESGLYVIQKDKKYGVYDLAGRTKIYPDNDMIGIDDITPFARNNIKNKYILVNNLIPAKKGELWGLYDINGNQLTDYTYDQFGYIPTDDKALSLLVIPDYNVIVACKNEKYNLLNSRGKELFAPIADDIYMTDENGQLKYWMNLNNNRYNVIDDILERLGVHKNSSNSSTNTNQENQDQQNNQEQQNQNQQNNEEQQNQDQQNNEEQQNQDQQNNEEQQNNGEQQEQNGEQQGEQQQEQQGENQEQPQE